MASAYTMTPNPADPFSRWMADYFDEKDVVAVATGFQSLFGRPENGGQTLYSPDSLTVDIDIIRANERTAALIPRGMISRPLNKQQNLNVEKYSAFSRLFPLVEEEGDITGNQILYRVAGENPYERRGRLERMRHLGRKVHAESVRRIVRLFERLAAQSVLDGEQDAILGAGSDSQFDFLRSSDNSITVDTEWNAAEGADPMNDIDAACDQVRVASKTRPDMMILGGEAMDALLGDEAFLERSDNRRFELIDVGLNNQVPPHYQRYVDAGFNARGRLRTAKGYELWMFTYIDVYTDESGNSVKYMPDDKAIVLSSRARFDRYFGPPEQLPMIPMRMQLYTELFGMSPDAPAMPPNMMAPGAIIDPAMFYADAYVSQDWKKVSIRTQAAPIFATTQTDAVVTLSGLISEGS